jgi:hypothetical protein
MSAFDIWGHSQGAIRGSAFGKYRLQAIGALRGPSRPEASEHPAPFQIATTTVDHPSEVRVDLRRSSKERHHFLGPVTANRRHVPAVAARQI